MASPLLGLTAQACEITVATAAFQRREG